MFRILLRLMLGFAFLYLAGAWAADYRFEDIKKNAFILQPNTRISTLSGKQLVSIDVTGVLNSRTRCGKDFTNSKQFGAKRVWIYDDGGFVRALRFQGGFELFQSPYDIGEALNDWWSANKSIVDKCLAPETQPGSDNTKRAILRSLIGQRPLTAEQAIDTWFRPATELMPLSNPEPKLPKMEPIVPRALVLRPGMRVCVADVISSEGDYQAMQKLVERFEDLLNRNGTLNSQDAGKTSKELKGELSNLRTGFHYALGGTSCALVADNGRGLHFDPITAMYSVPIGSESWDPGPGGGRRNVTTWSEVQRPYAERTVFVIVHPSNWKETPVSEDNVDNVPQLIAVDRQARIPVIPLYGASQIFTGVEAILVASQTNRGIDNLCKGNGNGAMCIQFGERGLFTVYFPVTVNGDNMDVAVGTTLGTLIDLAAPDFISYDLVGAADPNRLNDPAARERLMRTLHNVRVRRWFAGRLVRVKLDSEKAVEFPLQPGDQIIW